MTKEVLNRTALQKDMIERERRELGEFFQYFSLIQVCNLFSNCLVLIFDLAE